MGFTDTLLKAAEDAKRAKNLSPERMKERGYEAWDKWDDGSTYYANHKKLWIKFFSVHTGRALKFKGFLTDFSDKFTSNWNEETVYGRMDPIVTYQGTSRGLNFGFGVPAATEYEALDNFAKLSLLISLLYPGYSGGSSTSISSAPLFKVQFSNWVDTGGGGKIQETGLVGAIKGIDFTPDLEAGFFDLVGSLTPKVFNVSIDMTVLHTHALGWNADGTWRNNDPWGLGAAGIGTNLEGGFPYGQPFPENPPEIPLPDKQVTQTTNVGASEDAEGHRTGGTQEMEQAAAEQLLGGGTSVDPTQAGAPMTSADAPQTVNYLDRENS